MHRHRALAAGLAATFVALIAGLAVSLVALRRARKAEALAQEREVGMLRLADQRRLDDLLARADSLWPAEPELVPELERWLKEAEELGARLPLHRDFLSSLRSEASSATDETSHEGRAWLADVQERLISRLEAFVGEGSQGACLDELRRRTDRAHTLRARTVDAFAAEWERTCAAIAASPRYGGLEIEPQPGLVPLGPDPDSGLEEFALFELTGPMPRRDAADGRLVLADDFGIVLVLIPGGLAWIGAQSDDPALPNYTWHSRPNAGPPHLVALEPFFLSKFEVTKGQWRAAELGEPSYLKIGGSAYDSVHTPRFPLESISWTESQRLLPAVGLLLPTEAQWEYAARAGTSGGWWTGDSHLDLMGVANLADPRGPDAPFPECYWDGSQGWGPVGAHRANPFGLHDVYGSVYEWCRETYWVRQYDFPARYGDGLRLVPEDTLRVARGGSCFDTARVASSHYRSDFLAHAGNNQIGLRPARPLRGNWSWPGP
ncbi:MAG: formylglycine-generating enzyme family protein [Planctomycetaceae bacterium]|nr:formylglycine-generating enzyme family protein [Planctomycetaceae bacterium]